MELQQRTFALAAKPTVKRTNGRDRPGQVVTFERDAGTEVGHGILRVPHEERVRDGFDDDQTDRGGTG